MAPVASKESLSLDSGNPSPTEEMVSAQISLTDDQEELDRSNASAAAAVASNTHIIRVISGPVTNLDDTIVSAAVASSTSGASAGNEEVPSSLV